MRRSSRGRQTIARRVVRSDAALRPVRRCLICLALAVHLPVFGEVHGQGPVILPPITGLDEFVRVPDDNPLSLPAIALGRRLFFDTRLSRDGTRACASCHNPGLAFADSLSRSSGVAGRVAARHTPAIINRAWGSSFFWDGRAESLEQAVLMPISNPRELDFSPSTAITVLASDRGVASAFVEAFGTAPDTTTLARALASYVRTIRSGDSRFDRFRSGEPTALSAAEQRGMALFVGEARCSRCHVGANLTDEDFHNTGTALGSRDHGREGVTGRREDNGKFRTPTLRDVPRTPPYMHDGSLPTLEAVIEFYDGGGKPSANLDREIKPLHLKQAEKADLAAFLRALTSSGISCGPVNCVP